MDMYSSLLSAASVLNEQIARQIFNILPEDGPVMVIMDGERNHWPSDAEKFSELKISEPLLREICAKIDDGAEPVVTKTNDCCIVASQLTTEKTNCGYAIIILPHAGSESTVASVELVEILLNLIGLVAKLIEKNNLLYELQIKYHGMYNQS